MTHYESKYWQVQQWHHDAGVEMPTEPTMMSRGGTSLRDNNILDFYSIQVNNMSNDMKMVSKSGFGGKVLERVSYLLEEIAELLAARTLEDQVDAFTDIAVFNEGNFTLVNVESDPIFYLVMSANNAKKFPDGTFHRDAQGKIIKPDGWKENHSPERLIKEEIERQRKWGTKNEG